jgi:hypothetical protein
MGVLCDCNKAPGGSVESRDEVLINPAQQVIGWNVLIKVEGIEKSVLIAALGSHHQEALLHTVLGRKHLRSRRQIDYVFQQNRPAAAG